MSEFHRSPSKVWWHDEDHQWPRRSSASPGSQDSGFSDTEPSPPVSQQAPERQGTPKSTRVPKDILKEISEESQNLSSNFKQKSSPHKRFQFSSTRAPLRNLNGVEVRSEPTKKHRFHRNGSLKVSRSLFTSYQYAEEEAPQSNTKHESWDEDGVSTPDNSFALQRNGSAPAIFKLSVSGEEDPFHSDSGSELGSFRGFPQHTSTPKARKNMRYHRSRRAGRILPPTEERIPPINPSEEPSCVQKWLNEARDFYEPECMTALQCKSIAAELAQKVVIIATRMTSNLRKLLSDSQTIITEFANTKSQKQHTGPLAQSLARLTEEFVTNHAMDDDSNVLKICEQIRCCSSDISELIIELQAGWEILQYKILVREIKNLVAHLEDPQSELHVRAALTGLTSIALHNKETISVFITCNAVSVLSVLCEKCESSTVRSLVLRALSTICSDGTAVRQFENAAGIQLISETVAEETRPEPERSEAVALLAQITAPWIEDNRNVQGLQEHVKIIVKALTHFISTTKCCQNLLLCTAALANLTEMEPKSIKYILHQNSVGHILKVIKMRSSVISIYLLEQVASLIANLSTKVNARKLLIEEHAPAALLHFLHCNHADPEVETRLQQKSVIALSRLSSDPEAAKQIVKCDGVSRLVTLCRERKERHDSDAVLVAALATLRKIAEACGSAVIESTDVQELVEPRLLDSFLAYSAQNESYV